MEKDTPINPLLQDLSPNDLRDIIRSRSEEIARYLSANLEPRGGGSEAAEELLPQEEEEEEEDGFFDDGPRLPPHALNEAGKFMIADSTTLTIPADHALQAPVDELLAPYTNKHLTEAATRTFGGDRQLSQSLRVLTRTRNPGQQHPLPLSAGQYFMSDIDASVFMAVLWPGMYASSLSVLSEVRKRLGSAWLCALIKRRTEDGGAPRFLDAGTGGAAAMAWKDVLGAELEVMREEGDDSGGGGAADAESDFAGRRTVLAASDALRHRASRLLDDTSFLPRLPDYVHVRHSQTEEDARDPPKRKEFDVIIASHELWALKEDYERKEHVQNLWSMLNPNGGVLILIEKGIQRGFEVIAGARKFILDDLLAPQCVMGREEAQAQKNHRAEEHDEGAPAGDIGMIIAPCTNHAKCPMYTAPGKSVGRKDYCSFKQRFHRPSYLSAILSHERGHNHEDVQFSYLAVQRGRDLRDATPNPTATTTTTGDVVGDIIQGDTATDLAFAGYENTDAQRRNLLRAADKYHTPPPPLTLAHASTHPLSLPRILWPPLKRSGHVALDVCTPAGKVERWTVAKSSGKVPYKAARKSEWGDLWALGAKTRTTRGLRLGEPERTAKSKKKKLKNST